MFFRMEHCEERELSEIIKQILKSSSTHELTIFLSNVYNQTKDGSPLSSLTVARTDRIVEMTKFELARKTDEILKTTLTGLKPFIEQKIEADMEQAIMKRMREIQDSGFYRLVCKKTMKRLE